MQTSGRGGLLNKRFGLQDPPTLVTTISSDKPITFSHLRVDSSGVTLGNIPGETAYSVSVHMRDTIYQIREGRQTDGKELSKAGNLCLFDLHNPPHIAFDTPFRIIRSYIPVPALEEFAEETGRRRPIFLRPPSRRTADPVIRYLFKSLEPILEHPEDEHSLFVDHIALALQDHLLQTYASPLIEDRPVRRGLAPWQERRAKEAMNANVHRNISVAELARECGLSNSRFARAFRQATGQPPHRWLVERRVETAQGLLLTSQMSIHEIAIACGFADQSALTRVFTRIVGASPAAWRRIRQG
jgi:AraC-like DNA-binding protein